MDLVELKDLNKKKHNNAVSRNFYVFSIYTFANILAMKKKLKFSKEIRCNLVKMFSSNFSSYSYP
jgi:hypothetical protein